MQEAILTAKQRADFERDGFLIVPDALPADMVGRLTEVIDRLYAEGVQRDGLSRANHWQTRNCVLTDDIFLQLLDWPATVPLGHVLPQDVGVPLKAKWLARQAELAAK